jgi:hypothetical protein
MSIPAPWLVAQRPPSIQRTQRLHWRSQSHSLSSRGASASSSDPSSGDPSSHWSPTAAHKSLTTARDSSPCSSQMRSCRPLLELRQRPRFKRDSGADVHELMEPRFSVMEPRFADYTRANITTARSTIQIRIRRRSLVGSPMRPVCVLREVDRRVSQCCRA